MATLHALGGRVTVAAAGDGIPPLPGGGLGTHQGFLNTFLSLPTSQPLPPPAGIYLLSHPQVPLSPSCWPPPTGLLGPGKLEALSAARGLTKAGAQEAAGNKLTPLALP